MTPKPFTIYKMKKSVARTLACVRECGNNFRYFNDAKTYINMECMRCGYKYHTQVDTFDCRYEEDKDGIPIKDPNMLFKGRKNYEYSI